MLPKKLLFTLTLLSGILELKPELLTKLSVLSFHVDLTSLPASEKDIFNPVIAGVTTKTEDFVLGRRF